MTEEFLLFHKSSVLSLLRESHNLNEAIITEDEKEEEEQQQ